MSRSIKTRELFFQSLNSKVANNTTGSWSPILINIPETNPVFTNVIAEVYCDDDAIAAANVTKRALTFNLGVATPIHINNTSAITQTGENISFQHSYDITSHFTSNWSGTNLGATASFVYAGSISGSSNWGLRLCMTYEYDMNSPTQSKTIFFPIGFRNSLLSNTSSIGTIPALTEFLPESNITINQVNFIYEVNEASTSTALDHNLGFQIGSNNVHYTNLIERALSTSRTIKYIYSTTEFDTGSVNDFKLYSSVNNQFWYLPNVYAAVDYQYSPSSSRILNSVRIPFHFENQMNISRDSTSWFRQKINYLINEPGIIVPTTSSILLFNTKSTTTIRLYTRIDSGSSFFQYQQQTAGTGLAGYYITPITSSNGFNIRKGRNELYVDFYKDSTATGGGLSGLCLLNYYSDNGDVNKHNKTIINNFINNNNTGSTTANITTLHNIWIPESASFFHLNSIGDEYNYISSLSTANFNLFYSKSLDEFGEDKQNTLDSILYDGSEIGNKKFYTSTDNLFKKTNEDITRNLHPTQSRQVILVNGQGIAIHPSNATYYTYNTISFQVSGSVQNSVGNTIILDLYRDYDNKKIQTQTRIGDGLYSFLVPDSEDTYYVIAKEGNAIVISKIDYPISGSFNINFLTGSINQTETFF